MPPPELPKYQDCHELWSKKRRRQQREQEVLAAARGGAASSGGAIGDSSNLSTAGTGAIKTEGSGSLSGGLLSNLPASRSTSQPGSEKLEENSLQG